MKICFVLNPPIYLRSRCEISISIWTTFSKMFWPLVFIGIIIEHTHCLWIPVLGISSLSTCSAVAFFSSFIFECRFDHFSAPCFGLSLTMFFVRGISIVVWAPCRATTVDDEPSRCRLKPVRSLKLSVYTVDIILLFYIAFPVAVLLLIFSVPLRLIYTVSP